MIIKNIIANKMYWLIMSILLLLILIMVYFSSRDLPDKAGVTVIISFICAIVGAFITLLITERQLENQSKHGLETKKNSKVFEERLEVYKNYINTVSKVFTQGSIKKDEKLNLEIATALLALHTNGENLKSIANDINAIILERNKTIDGTNAQFEKVLMLHLLNIVDQLKKQLYEGQALDYVKITEKDRNEIGDLFINAYTYNDDVDETDKEDKNTTPIKSAQDTRKIHLTQWDKAVERWRQKGWEVLEGWESDANNQWFTIKRQDGSPGEISNGVRNFQSCIKVSYGNDKDFSYDLIINPLPGIKDAQRKAWLWWTNDERLGADGVIADNMEKNPELQEFLIELIEGSMQRIEKWKQS